jgi:hypothetical protein
LPFRAARVQVEIERLAPDGSVVSGVTLDAGEDGVLMRAQGPSLMSADVQASYTITMNVQRGQMETVDVPGW